MKRCKFGMENYSEISEVTDEGITKSGNFKLKNICPLDLNVLYNTLNAHDVIFWNFKVMPTAFFFSWNIKLLYKELKERRFWTVERINGEKK